MDNRNYMVEFVITLVLTGLAAALLWAVGRLARVW
jgi:hypothetical protein